VTSLLLRNGNNFDVRFVGRFMTRRERIDMMGDRAKKFTNVYVKNFGDALDDDKMRELFETCGLITSCKVRLLVIICMSCIGDGQIKVLVDWDWNQCQ